MWRRIVSSHLKTLAAAASPRRSIAATARPVRFYLAADRSAISASSSVIPRHFSSDSDTHDDFKPTQKVTSASTDSFKDIVENDVKENPVMIYMKGVPESPQCGFSSLAVRVLQQYNVPIGARNILEDQELKTAVKSFSHWPTFPQIFIKGEFIGGSDIILNMHKEGELEEKLKDVSGNQKSQ